MDEMDINRILEARKEDPEWFELHGDELTPTPYYVDKTKRNIRFIHTDEEWLKGTHGRFVRYSKINGRTMVPGFTPFLCHVEV